MKQKVKILAASILTPLVLAGCGGGEDTADPGMPTATSATLLASFLDNLDSVRSAANLLVDNDRRYTNQQTTGHLEINGNGRYDPDEEPTLGNSPIRNSGIHYAHAAGLTGAGETIAISDSGFLTSHETLSGKTLTTGAGVTVDDHGTFVASVAAGVSSNMIGVAPGADLVLGMISLDGLTVSTSSLTATANAAATAGAVALNNSWGLSGVDATTANYNGFFSSSGGRDYLNALKNYAQNGIVLFAVANEEPPVPSVGLLAGLPLFEPTLQDSWLAVVNAMPEQVGDDIVSATLLSSACHSAAAWCIAADGTWLGAVDASIASYAYNTGTSFAAPTVAGALALLAEAFPTMTHQELRIRLLASADNDFAEFTQAGTITLAPGFNHAYSNEFGHGFLDVAAALLPIGTTVTTTSNGTEIDLKQPLVVAGGASGDAVSRALQNVEVATKDSLSASFGVQGSALVVNNSIAPLFSNDDVARFDDVQETSFGGAAFFGDGHHIPMDWGDSDMSFAFYHKSEIGSESLGFGASRSFDLDVATFEVSAAFGDDTSALLSDWNGGTSSSLVSVGMALAADLSEAAQIKFEAGFASGREASALGQSANVIMNAASLSIAQQDLFKRGDSITASLALPAAISHGSTSIGLEVFAADGTTSMRHIPIDLSPEKREVRLSLTYQRPISDRSNLGVSFVHAQNRGHIAGRDETGMMFGINTRF
ncbi:S8 family serine peptidase [Cognatishimia activa]|uniref:S8 family serine peptidase n=1 Tax=Cognatishimia activa TaxID=1715691 RepID=UPI00071E2440|nr:S8 family serine peptidase [Cognatishimia activa]